MKGRSESQEKYDKEPFQECVRMWIFDLVLWAVLSVEEYEGRGVDVPSLGGKFVADRTLDTYRPMIASPMGHLEQRRWASLGG